MLRRRGSKGGEVVDTVQKDFYNPNFLEMAVLLQTCRSRDLCCMVVLQGQHTPSAPRRARPHAGQPTPGRRGAVVRTHVGTAINCGFKLGPIALSGVFDRLMGQQGPAAGKESCGESAVAAPTGECV